jgi:hypothetical protein
MVEEAFRPAVSPRKIPALAAEVLLDHLPTEELPQRLKPICFSVLLAGLKACSTLESLECGSKANA